MKLIINKKHTSEVITLDLESTTTVHKLLSILYGYRSKSYDYFSFSEYQKFILVYQCDLYGEQFKNKLLLGTNLADYQLEDPCNLTWEEFPDNRCLMALLKSDLLGSKTLFWQANMKDSQPEIAKESISNHNLDKMKSSIS